MFMEGRDAVVFCMPPPALPALLQGPPGGKQGEMKCVLKAYTPPGHSVLPDGEINHALLAEHAADLAAKVDGLGVGGTTGEYYALSFDERVRTFNTVAEAAGGKSWLTAGINATTTSEVIRLGQAAKAAGMSALLVAAPYYAQPTQEELLEHLLKVDDALDLPIMLYNFPARTGTAIGDEILETLLQRPNFRP
jgi:4-hydroxy-tetrahydrodipicolinate synthase